VSNPVVAQVIRSGVVESWHRGAVVGLDRAGTAVVEAGAIRRPMFPRSASKPLQAVGLLRAGLADLPALDEAMVALAAASHSGAQMHLDGVRDLLAAAGLSEQDLGNVADLPSGDAERRAWRREGRHKTRLAMNCSGKHAAMLATCVLRGWPLEGYLRPDHPVQVAVMDAVAELTGEAAGPLGVDGCGAPLKGVSVDGIARAFRRLVTAPAPSPEARVAAAMRAHPELVGGSGRDVTALMRLVPGMIAKDGAEGVYVAALEDGRAVALKVDDGAARARMPVLVDVLERLGVAVPDLRTYARIPVYGGGQIVGEVRSALAPAGEDTSAAGAAGTRP
jgi:L-asparaginase II